MNRAKQKYLIGLVALLPTFANAHGLFGQNFEITKTYCCKPNTSHSCLVTGNKIKPRRVLLFWKSIRTEQNPGADKYKPKKIKGDSNRLFSEVALTQAGNTHQHCLLIELNNASGTGALDAEIFLRNKQPNFECDDALYWSDSWKEGIRSENGCGESHTGGWQARGG